MPRRTLKVEKGLIPVTTHVDDAPIVNLDKVVPNTYYRRRNDNRYVFLTIMQDGLYVGWDTCGSCHDFAALCKCPSGITTPDSVVHIYESRNRMIDEGKLEKVTFVDKETVKPSRMVAQVEDKGQVSAPRKRPQRRVRATQDAPKPRKLKRIKRHD